jgi:PIN domain nuclease of toxin-antitoxin system
VSGLLLDTHVWLWYAEGMTDELRMPEVKVLERSRRRGGLWVSAISVWEIGVRQQKGRIRLSTPARGRVQRALDPPGIRFAPLGAAAAAESTLLPGEPRADPADLFLIATARVERLALSTRDDRILEYSRKGFVRSLAL